MSHLDANCFGPRVFILILISRGKYRKGCQPLRRFYRQLLTLPFLLYQSRVKVTLDVLFLNFMFLNWREMSLGRVALNFLSEKFCEEVPVLGFFYFLNDFDMV